MTHFYSKNPSCRSVIILEPLDVPLTSHTVATMWGLCHYTVD